MRIFKLGADLQLFVYNNGITFKISKLIVGPILRCVLGRKVTLRTLCTYEKYLRTLFMERRPGKIENILQETVYYPYRKRHIPGFLVLKEFMQIFKSGAELQLFVHIMRDMVRTMS